MIYKGIKVESSLPLDSIIFHEEEPEKPTPAIQEEEKPKATPKEHPERGDQDDCIYICGRCTGWI